MSTQGESVRLLLQRGPARGLVISVLLHHRPHHLVRHGGEGGLVDQAVRHAARLQLLGNTGESQAWSRLAALLRHTCIIF